MSSGDLDVVSLLVSSSVNTFSSERHFPVGITIADLKRKLELLAGASPETVILQLRDKDGRLVAKLDDDSATLGSYPVKDGMNILVEDPLRKQGEFEDISQVTKFELSEEEYSRRGESLRAFKQSNKLGRFDQSNVEKNSGEEQREEELAKGIDSGRRCEVAVRGQPKRRGTVMFVGQTDFKPGYWVGIKYDEPLGKNDGSVGGKRYFDCPPKYGGFVRPSDIAVGDFPELGTEQDDEF